MKRIFLLMLAMIVSVFIVGCTDDNVASMEESKASVAPSESVLSEIVSDETVSKDEASSEIASTDISQDNVYQDEYVSVSLPEGFYIDEISGTNIAYPEDYPVHTDNISIVTTEGQDSLDNYDKQLMEEYYGTIFEGFEKISRFEKTKISGADAIIMEYDMSVADVIMTQTQYMLIGDGYVAVVTYTSVSGDFDNEFEISAQTIKLLK